ncbi:MAG TPA: anti-sigma factor [Candidatus Eisenbacteria bacterium]|nr:anti-sigma factor [Candidatus Eisenbacteria bacterium]
MALDDVDQQDQAVQYVLGELPAPEARDLERRMASDAALAAEVRRLQTTLGLLPYATIAEPPPALKTRIMSAAEAQHGKKQVRRPRRVVWSRFAAAIAASLALALGIDSYRTHRELSIERQVSQLLLEPNVVKSFSIAGTGGAGGIGTVALDLDSKRGAVVLRGAAVLPAGQTYRLWAQVADRAVPCGDFAPAGDGTVRAAFRVPVDAYTDPISKLFVTIEPSGPSEKPTGPVVMQSA